MGNISTSYLGAKKLSGKDIRTQGSGNAGSTNVMRNYGKKAGAMTFAGDLLKGILAVFIGQFIAKFMGLNVIVAGYWAVVGVVCGHNWPAVLGFRGGKGVATLLGVGFGLIPIPALIALGIFMVVLFCFGYVSLASITAAVTLPFVTYFFVMPDNILLLLLTIAVAIFLPITHRQNIKRLLDGTENKFLKKK